MLRALPDTRPYPTDPVKNELLMYAGQIAEGKGGVQAKLAAESLRASIFTMLSQNHYLGLSVAMSMAPDAASYRALLAALSDTLGAKTEAEVEWFALPVVLVAGTNQAAALPAAAPTAELSACLANYPHTREFSRATWLPHLVSSADLAAVNAGQWFAAKQNAAAAAEFAATFTANELPFAAGQSVQLVFALGYGEAGLREALGVNLQEAALPLMQVWQQNLSAPGLTLFANPLTPDTPLQALVDGRHMRLRMALDVFAANAIRAIRLQSPRVGVVMAAQEGGRLLFGFNATASQFELQPQVFSWPLSPAERIEIIQQDFLDLMVECQVENIRQLDAPLPDGADLPSYAQALEADGFNPLFAG